ncbi:MAG TPA: hypothetical protein VLU46_13890 [Thermoanaerobaculia bacterium]|nr:hypothetical protein [Thermoanaerobaculia bacterium]
MTNAIALAAYLLLPLFGLVTWRVDVVRRMNLAGRIAIAAAGGALTIAVAMALMSVAHVAWTRTSVTIVFAILAIANIALARRPLSTHHPALSTLGSLLFIALTFYGAMTARETCGDLAYFWGPKAVQFHRAGGVSADFLRNPDFYSMHPDYPPLVPLVYAWSSVFAGKFSWWAAVLTAPLLLAATVALVGATSGDAAGALLVAATLAYAFPVAFAAGGADPALVFFEALAICALVFVRDPRAQTILAAIGTAGAVWTKIEGTTFAIALVVALVLVRRQWKRAAAIAMPAIVLLAGWVVFIVAAGVVDMFAAAGRYPVHPSVLPTVLQLMGSAASYDLFWLPWIAPVVVIAFGDVRRALFPIAIAILTILAAIYFYVHVTDPAWWIAASAPRVLLTPLLALDIAAIAASTPSGVSAGQRQAEG